MSDDVTITMGHIREARFCRRGAKEWFESHGIDWNSFLERGVPVEALESTGDPLALKVVAIARREAEDGRRRQ